MVIRRDKNQKIELPEVLPPRLVKGHDLAKQRGASVTQFAKMLSGLENAHGIEVLWALRIWHIQQT